MRKRVVATVIAAGVIAAGASPASASSYGNVYTDENSMQFTYALQGAWPGGSSQTMGWPTWASWTKVPRGFTTANGTVSGIGAPITIGFVGGQRKYCRTWFWNGYGWQEIPRGTVKRVQVWTKASTNCNYNS